MSLLIFFAGCGVIFWANQIIRSSQKTEEESPYSSGIIHFVGGIVGMIGALLFIYGGFDLLFSMQK